MLKQSTAYTIAFFMVSSTDHLSAKTGAAPVVNISKAGAAFGAAGGAVTELTNGWYKCALSTTDTNTLGDLAFHITGTGADDADFREQVFAKTVDDLMSTFTLPTNFSAFSLDASGRVDVGKVLGTAQTAGDLKASLNTLQADTDDIQTRLPAALVGGRMDSSVGAMAAAVITATSIAAAALNGKGDWLTGDSSGVTTLLARLSAARALLLDNLDATVSSRSTYAGADTAGTTTLLARLTATRAALLDFLDAAISSRSVFAGGAVASVTGNVGGNVVGSVGSVVATVPADIKKINGTTVNGDGSVTPWGP